jgi:hypothetical protein
MWITPASTILSPTFRRNTSMQGSLHQKHVLKRPCAATNALSGRFFQRDRKRRLSVERRATTIISFTIQMPRGRDIQAREAISTIRAKRVRRPCSYELWHLLI